jgi:hypothetical protein
MLLLLLSGFAFSVNADVKREIAYRGDSCASGEAGYIIFHRNVACELGSDHDSQCAFGSFNRYFDQVSCRADNDLEIYDIKSQFGPSPSVLELRSYTDDKCTELNAIQIYNCDGRCYRITGAIKPTFSCTVRDGAAPLISYAEPDCKSKNGESNTWNGCKLVGGLYHRTIIYDRGVIINHDRGLLTNGASSLSEKTQPEQSADSIEPEKKALPATSSTAAASTDLDDITEPAATGTATSTGLVDSVGSTVPVTNSTMKETSSHSATAAGPHVNATPTSSSTEQGASTTATSLAMSRATSAYSSIFLGAFLIAVFAVLGY